MAKQTINLGSGPDSYTGDSLNVAFTKINENFTDLYSGNAAGNIRASGNIIANTSLRTDGFIRGQSLEITANAVVLGTISANNFTYANGVAIGNFSSSNINTSGNISGNTITANSFTGIGNFTDVTITGNLQVNGSTTYIDVTRTSVKDPLMEIGGNSSGGALTSDDSKDRGFILHYFNGAARDAFLGWDASSSEFRIASNAIVVNNEVLLYDTYANVRAGYFIGNGSQLTGITSYANSNVVAYAAAGWAGNIIPSANVTYDLGSPTKQWRDIFVSNGSVYIGNIKLSNDNGTLKVQQVTDAGLDTESPVPGSPGSVTTDRLINDDKEVVLTGGANPYVTFPTVASGENIYIQGAEIASTTGTVAITSSDSVVVNTNALTATKSWQFSNTGNLELPQFGVIGEQPNPSGFPGHSVFVKPSGYLNDNQQLLVYPTGGNDFNHLHLTSGDLYDTELYLGNDDLYVKLANTGNVEIRADDNSGNSAQWTFNKDGTTTFPNGLYFGPMGEVYMTGGTAGFGSTDYDVNIWANANGISQQFNFGVDGSLTTPSNLVIGPGPGSGSSILQYNDTLQIVGEGANSAVIFGWAANQSAPDSVALIGMNTPYADGTSNVLIAVGNNATTVNYWLFDNSGNLTLPGNIISDTGDVISNNVFVTGSIQPASFASPAPSMSGFDSISAANITANYFIGNGSQLTGITAGTNYTDSNVTSLLASLGSNAISTTGNISGGNISASGDITVGGNLTINGTTTTINATTLTVADLNITLANGAASASAANGAGISVNGASATMLYISSTDTWNFNKTLVGNLTGVASSATVAASANAVAGANVSGQVANALVAGTVYTAAQPNITSVGNLTSLAVTGNITAGNILTNNYFYANGVAFTPGSNYGDSNVTSLLAALGSNSISTTGNITAGNISGNISITGNVTGTSTNVTLVAGSYNWTFNNTGNLVLPGNTFGINYANGAAVSLGSGGAGNYSDSNVVSLLGAYGSNTIVTTGNVTGGNLISSSTVYGNVDVIVGDQANTLATKTRMVSAGAFSYIQTGNGTSGTTGNIVFAPYASITQKVVVDTSSGNISTIGNTVFTTNNGSIVFNTGSYITGSAGGVSVGGNIYVSGGNATTGNNSIVAGATNTLLANSTASFTANVNSYAQITYQNKNSGVDATADFILTADNGSDVTNYSDLGIINSGYDNATPTNSLGNIVYAADTYLYAQGNLSNTSQSGGNLVIGTTTASKNVKIFAGGNTAAALVANISNVGVSIAGSLTTTGNITTANITGTSANVTITANNYVSTFDTTGLVTLPGNLTVNGSGGIKMPNLPAFRVYGTVSTQITANTTVNSTHGTTVDYNQGSYYNNTTGIFTAPIAGLYHCYATLRVGTNNGLNQASIQKNSSSSGANVVAFWETDTNIGTATHFSMTGYAKCAVGDTLRLQVISGNINLDSNDSWGITYIG